MKKLLVPLLWLLLVLTIAYSVREAIRAVRETVAFEQDTTRLFTQLEVDRIVHDSTIALNARSENLDRRFAAVAQRLTMAAGLSRRSADSLDRLLPTLRNTRDSLQNALGQTISLRVGYDSLKLANDTLTVRVDSLRRDNRRLFVSDSLGWKNVDSLQALIRRTPTCRKIPLLGIPLPKVGLGYAVTTGGQGVGIGVVVPLSCH